MRRSLLIGVCFFCAPSLGNAGTFIAGPSVSGGSITLNTLAASDITDGLRVNGQLFFQANASAATVSYSVQSQLTVGTPPIGLLTMTTIGGIWSNTSANRGATNGMLRSISMSSELLGIPGTFATVTTEIGSTLPFGTTQVAQVSSPPFINILGTGTVVPPYQVAFGGGSVTIEQDMSIMFVNLQPGDIVRLDTSYFPPTTKLEPVLVPEPSSIVLSGIGLLGVLVTRLRFKTGRSPTLRIARRDAVLCN